MSVGTRVTAFRRRYIVRLGMVLRFVPDRGKHPVVPAPWQPFARHVPEELLDLPGERRDRAAELAIAEQAPLHEFFTLHYEATNYLIKHGKGYILPVLPRLVRSLRNLRRAARTQPSIGQPRGVDGFELTNDLRAEAQRLGLSRIGIAQTDPVYTFATTDSPQLPTVVVCILEQDWAMTQTAPSVVAEQAAFHGYIDGMNRTAGLTEFLTRRGYRAYPQGFQGDGVAIHYAVEAGLGQLGLNGQLLTPQAGSRIRILMLTTDAPLVLDAPVDYGLHGICDECRACVRNCPVGAIPQSRKPYRGVVKAKLNTSRCLPVVIEAAGCAVCMKVCPVQRYGLDAILEHRDRTGQILGLGSDELEGYDWPLDGQHYGPGETPRVDDDILQPPGLIFDPARTVPIDGMRPITFVGDILSGGRAAQ